MQTIQSLSSTATNGIYFGNEVTDDKTVTFTSGRKYMLPTPIKDWPTRAYKNISDHKKLVATLGTAFYLSEKKHVKPSLFDEKFEYVVQSTQLPSIFDIQSIIDAENKKVKIDNAFIHSCKGPIVLSTHDQQTKLFLFKYYDKKRECYKRTCKCDIRNKPACKIMTVASTKASVYNYLAATNKKTQKMRLEKKPCKKEELQKKTGTSQTAKNLKVALVRQKKARIKQTMANRSL